MTQSTGEPLSLSQTNQTEWIKFESRGFIYFKGWRFVLLILSHFSYLSHGNEIIWSH